MAFAYVLFNVWLWVSLTFSHIQKNSEFFWCASEMSVNFTPLEHDVQNI